MPTIYDLKSRFQMLLRPAVVRLYRLGVTANQVTLVAAILSVVGGGSIAAFRESAWPLLAMPVVLLLRMAMNAMDGMLAREFGQKSRLGGLLNELCDVISDVALYLPLALVTGVEPVLVVGFVFAGLIAEFAGVLGIGVGGRRYDGPMGKSDRAFAIGLFSFLLALGLLRPLVAHVYLIMLIFLSVVTVINRSSRALEAGVDETKHLPIPPFETTITGERTHVRNVASTEERLRRPGQSFGSIRST